MSVSIPIFPDICPYESIYHSVGVSYDVPWFIIAAQDRVESEFNPEATGKDNEVGLGQLMPSTWVAFGDGDPFDPADNIMAHTRYLSFLKSALSEEGKVKWKWTLAAYNWGWSRVRPVDSWDELPQDVRNYVVNVFNYAMKYARIEVGQWVAVKFGFTGQGPYWRKARRDRLSRASPGTPKSEKKGGDTP